MSNIEPPKIDINQEIRIFISSTFRDMQEERDELIKYIFPQLKQICLERGVILIDIDLRWGITEEQAENKEVIPICLKEIDNSRPFFIGILGDRYGWIPDQLENELLMQYPWLRNHKNISVTEMEIRHGVLNNPAIASHALFYFRDPSYYDQISEERRKFFLETNSESIFKLNALKQELLQSGIKVFENYQSSQEVGRQILQDLTQIIDQEISENPLLKKRVPVYQEMMGQKEGPKGTPIDYFQKEKVVQKPFTDNLRKSFTIRNEYYELLDDFVNDQQSVFVLHGLKGIGKSALLVNWIDRYRLQNPKKCVVSFHAGIMSSYSNTLNKMLLQICWELKEFFQFDLELDVHSKIRNIFLQILEPVARNGGTLVVIDGLDKLKDNDIALKLDWLPQEFPSNIKFILSLTGNDPLKLLQKKNWISKELYGLTDSEKRQLIIDYLGQYGKSLTNSQISQVSIAEPMENPLYLKTFLDELRIFGIFEELDIKIDDYLKARDTIELYQKILMRIEEDYNRTGENIAIITFKALACSQGDGFTEDELRGILRVTPLEWSLFYNGVNEFLIKHTGGIFFRDEDLRVVVMQRYLSSREEILETHLRIAQYFHAQPYNSHNIDKFLWHYFKAERWQELKKVLLNPELFSVYYKHEDLVRYWEALEDISNPEVEYLKLLGKILEENSINYSKLFLIGKFLSLAGYDHGAEVFFRKFIELCEENKSSASFGLTTALNDLAILIEKSGREEEAEKLFQRSLDKAENVYTLANLGSLYAKQERYQEAERLYLRALTAIEAHPKAYSHIIPDISTVMADLLIKTNRYEEAEQFYRKALDIRENIYTLKSLADLLKSLNRIQEAESLYRQVLEIVESEVNDYYLIKALASNELAIIVFQKNDFNEAEILYQQALALLEQIDSSEDATFATILTNLAELYIRMNSLKKAEPLFRRALKIYEKIYGKYHPKVADTLNQLGLLLLELYRYQEAEPLYQRALSIYEENYRAEDSNVAKVLSNLAILYTHTSRLEDAEEYHKRALIIDEKILGSNHPNIAIILSGLGITLQLKEHPEYQKAEEFYNRALDIFESNYGENHVTVTSVLFNLASLYVKTERYKEAERLYSRALTFYEATYGSDHPMVGKTLTGIAKTSKNLKRYQEAEKLVLRAINIFEKSFGNDHSSLCSRLYVLSEIFHETNRTEAAISTLERALRINEISQIPDKQLVEKIRKKLDEIKNSNCYATRYN